MGLLKVDKRFHWGELEEGEEESEEEESEEEGEDEGDGASVADGLASVASGYSSLPSGIETPQEMVDLRKGKGTGDLLFFSGCDRFGMFVYLFNLFPGIECL